MTVDTAGPRSLLRRLRELMAGPQSAEVRLDRITTLIASNMVAEVCSIYVARTGERLELFATEGLNKSAVHDTILQVGEGLVGPDCRGGPVTRHLRCPVPSPVRLPA